MASGSPARAAFAPDAVTYNALRMRNILAILLIAISAGAQQTPSPDCCPAQPTAEKQNILWENLRRTVEQEDRRLDGVLGVAVLDLTDGRTLLWHADDVFPQASSIKITVLAELYRQAQEGKLKLTDLYTVRKEDDVADSAIFNGLTFGITQVTLRDLATMMIAVSDNSATNVLIDKVGTENVNAMLTAQGLKQTRLQRKMMDLNAAKQGRENIATPREMMTLLARIQQGKLLNPEMTGAFFKMLATSKHSPIRSAVPDAVVSADKPGELEGVRADSGVVFAQNRPFVICMMTTYDRDEDAANAAIGRIAAAAYSMFDRMGRASPVGRVISPFNSGPR
jgi:beta-lactamase class A